MLHVCQSPLPAPYITASLPGKKTAPSPVAALAPCWPALHRPQLRHPHSHPTSTQEGKCQLSKYSCFRPSFSTTANILSEPSTEHTFQGGRGQFGKAEWLGIPCLPLSERNQVFQVLFSYFSEAFPDLFVYSLMAVVPISSEDISSS